MEPLTLIGVPIDSVGRQGGTEHGPEALRALGLSAALGGADAGDLEVRIRGESRDPTTGLLGSEDVLATTRTLRAAVAELVAGGGRPFLAGGCCAELPGALAGARDALGEVGLVHLDGHIDLYTGETSTTGEAADMPVAVALGLGPDAWVEAAGGPSAIAERTAIVGFRDREESIEHGMRQPEELEPPPLLAAESDLRAAGHAGAAAGSPPRSPRRARSGSTSTSTCSTRPASRRPITSSAAAWTGTSCGRRSIPSSPPRR